MELPDLVAQVPGFDTSPPKDQIKLFAWWLHTHRAIELFGPADIRGCYDKLHMSQQAIATYLSRLVDSKDLLKEKSQYKLGRGVRAELDETYGVHHSVVAVSKLLSELPDKVPLLAEKTFLIEAMKCYRVEAFRATIVMAWNLAYDHLTHWVLNDTQRLADFNSAITRRYPKRTGITIAKRDDFEEFTEAEAVEVCYTAGLINKNTADLLREKLKRRNAAAHPSQVVIVQHQADDVITDLVNNVVLALT
jgi:hypothetical protein